MDLFTDFGLPTGLFLAALLLTIFILLRRTHRYLGRQKKYDGSIVRTARPPSKDRGHHLDAPPDVLRWEVQMHETARELSSQLDSKMSALQALIAEADRAATRLEAALGGPTETPQRPDWPDQPPADQASSLKSPQVGVPEGTLLKSSSAGRRYEEVYTLADSGLGAAEIADRTGSPIGEVELILGLRARK